MQLQRTFLLSSAFVLFFLLCASQWFFTKREDWPWSYFGMYKKRISPTNIYSFKLYGETPSGESVDMYLLAPFNYYSFTDEIEEIVRDRTVTNVNDELAASNELLVDDERLEKLEALFRKDLEPHLKKYKLDQKVKSFALNVRYWRDFHWDNRKTPDVHKTVLRAHLEHGEWKYSR